MPAVPGVVATPGLVRGRGELTRRLALFVVLALAGVPSSANAHNFAFTDVSLELREDGTYTVDVVCDLDALALGVPSTADSAALAAEIQYRGVGTLVLHVVADAARASAAPASISLTPVPVDAIVSGEGLEL